MKKYVVEEEFEHKGLRCVITFDRLGHRCGYVEVNKSCHGYGKEHNEIDIEVHGGITYAKEGGDYPVESNLYWLGFDCAHACDDNDVESAKKYFGEDVFVWGYGFGEIRDTGYVKQQCKDMVEQIIEKNGEKMNEE